MAKVELTYIKEYLKGDAPHPPKKVRTLETVVVRIDLNVSRLLHAPCVHVHTAKKN